MPLSPGQVFNVGTMDEQNNPVDLELQALIKQNLELKAALSALTGQQDQTASPEDSNVAQDPAAVQPSMAATENPVLNQSGRIGGDALPMAQTILPAAGSASPIESGQGPGLGLGQPSAREQHLKSVNDARTPFGVFNDVIAGMAGNPGSRATANADFDSRVQEQQLGVQQQNSNSVAQNADTNEKNSELQEGRDNALQTMRAFKAAESIVGQIRAIPSVNEDGTPNDAYEVQLKDGAGLLKEQFGKGAPDADFLRTRATMDVNANRSLIEHLGIDDDLGSYASITLEGLPPEKFFPGATEIMKADRITLENVDTGEKRWVMPRGEEARKLQKTQKWVPTRDLSKSKTAQAAEDAVGGSNTEATNTKLQASLMASQTSLRQLNSINDGFTEELLQTGPRVQNFIDKGLDKLGFADEKEKKGTARFAVFDSNTMKRFNDSIRAQSGLVINEGEAKRMMIQEANLSMSPAAFKALVENSIIDSAFAIARAKLALKGGLLEGLEFDQDGVPKGFTLDATGDVIIQMAKGIHDEEMENGATHEEASITARESIESDFNIDFDMLSRVRKNAGLSGQK